ncbi:PEP/pyruvate-binding domain-containing protein [Chloroflexota bacterium]
MRSLVDHGFHVPETYVCTWEAYTRFLETDASLLIQLKDELAKKLDLEKTYAVRSSANIEDNVNHSFAGQFKSFLDINGLEEILEAMQEIWGTAQSPDVRVYFERSQVEYPEILMGVVIQEMVTPFISGVSFSKNPITGLDEIIVEAVHGHGTAIVQDGATPDRWIYKWGEWIATPENAIIDQELIAQVVDQTKSIAKFFGKPADLEWVFDGDSIYWLQLRQISSLEGINLYSNKIAQDMLPGMIKPLIWSINIPLVNGAWVNLFTKLIGPNDIDPLSLAKSFYYRAYFNMSVIGNILEIISLPRETLELMMGIEVAGPDKPKFKPSAKTYQLLPRIFLFMLDMLRKPREIEKFFIDMKTNYLAFPVGQADQMDGEQLLTQIGQLYKLNQETAYYNIITPLSMQFYNALLKKQLEKQGIDYASFDLTHDLDELREVDPNCYLEQLAEQYRELNSDQKLIFSAGSYEEFMSIPDCEPLQQGVRKFIELFGHLSDSGNDFSYIPWRENPDLILRMIKTRAESEHKSIKKIRFEDINQPIINELFSKIIYQKARRYFLYREQIGSLYTFGYGLFRYYFLALGELFNNRRILNSKQDIFYLSIDEIRLAVNNPNITGNFIHKVENRKQEMERYSDTTPPTTIYGDKPLPIEETTGTTLEGTPTSRGYYQGPVKVVRGSEDFEQIESGDVLVVPFSDVGWTPIYVKAGAVVAESGGMLSHSSIVAREYGIPAVVSVPGACKLLTNKVVTVDGYRGKVIIHEN